MKETTVTISNTCCVIYDQQSDTTMLSCLADNDKILISLKGKPSDVLQLNTKLDPYGNKVHFLTLKKSESELSFSLRKSVNQVHVKVLTDSFEMIPIVHNGLMG